MTDNFSPETFPCPSCGRIIDSPVAIRAGRCQFCATGLYNRVGESTVLLWAVPLLVIALIYFYLAANVRIEYLPVSSLDRSKNFERVRVKGEIMSVRVYQGKYRKDNTVLMELADYPRASYEEEPETIRLKAEGEIGTFLVEKGLIPSVGDIVDVSATLYAGADYRSLSLGGHQFLKIIGHTERKLRFEKVTLDELISNPDKYKNKNVEIDSVYVSGTKGKWSIKIGKTIDSEALLVFGVVADDFLRGDLISVRGTFIWYDKGGYWELKTSRADFQAVKFIRKVDGPRGEEKFKKRDVELAPSVSGISVTLKQLLSSPEEYRGKIVKLERSRVKSKSEKYLLRVTDIEKDATEEIVVFGAEPSEFESGEIVSVTGEFIYYDKGGYWEIKTDKTGVKKSDGSEKNIPSTDRKPPERTFIRTTIGELLATPEKFRDKDVLVEKAIIVSRAEKFTISVSDPPESAGTSSQPLVVFGIAPEKYRTGQTVSVRGKFIFYTDGNYWEIKTAKGDDLAVRILDETDSSGKTSDEKKGEQ